MTGPKLPILRGYMIYNPDAPEGKQYMRKGLVPSKTPKIWAALNHLKVAMSHQVSTYGGCWIDNHYYPGKPNCITIFPTLKGWKVYDVATGEELPDFIHNYLVERANKMKAERKYYKDYEIVDLWQ